MECLKIIRFHYLYKRQFVCNEMQTKRDPLLFIVRGKTILLIIELKSFLEKTKEFCIVNRSEFMVKGPYLNVIT